MRNNPACLGIPYAVFDQAGMVFLNSQVMVNCFIQNEGAVSLLGFSQRVYFSQPG
ncbi:MAG TPA: hypothetical protein VKX41_07700 [Alloacidobacterium sp.]|nr:hypothetical protein [Alloacidobacterium sp.]